MNIYEKIKVLAKANNNQKICELEQTLGLPGNTLSKWSKNIPSIDKVIKIADYFNVPLDYFVGRTVAPTNENNSKNINITGTTHDNIVSNGDNNNFCENGQNKLTELELDLLEVFRKLSKDKKYYAILCLGKILKMSLKPINLIGTEVSKETAEWINFLNEGVAKLNKVEKENTTENILGRVKTGEELDRMAEYSSNDKAVIDIDFDSIEFKKTHTKK